ncbi:MAG: ATP-binding protein, partial [Firmicutes bacterium]|nr:ATP-binding protein [Bacillota bacterium]
VYASLTMDTIDIRVEDDGKGIKDVEKALRPAFSTDAERLGLGFVFMQSFMDVFQVDSAPGKGTVVIMSKRVSTRVAQVSPEQ